MHPSGLIDPPGPFAPISVQRNFIADLESLVPGPERDDALREARDDLAWRHDNPLSGDPTQT